jgi:hypothetical protein
VPQALSPNLTSPALTPPAIDSALTPAVSFHA